MVWRTETPRRTHRDTGRDRLQGDKTVTWGATDCQGEHTGAKDGVTDSRRNIAQRTSGGLTEKLPRRTDRDQVWVEEGTDGLTEELPRRTDRDKNQCDKAPRRTHSDRWSRDRLRLDGGTDSEENTPRQGSQNRLQREETKGPGEKCPRKTTQPVMRWYADTTWTDATQTGHNPYRHTLDRHNPDRDITQTKTQPRQDTTKTETKPRQDITQIRHNSDRDTTQTETMH